MIWTRLAAIASVVITSLLLNSTSCLASDEKSSAGDKWSTKSNQAPNSQSNNAYWKFLAADSESRLRQAQTGELTSFELINKTSDKLFGYWLNGQGKRQHFFDIGSGAKHSQQTYANHIWIIANSKSQAQAIIMAGTLPEVITISRTGNQFQNQSAESIKQEPLQTNNSVSKQDLPSKQTALSPASDLSSLPDEDTIPFAKNSSGHLIVQADLNGKRLDMIFDTGANGCSVGENHLRSAGIDTSTLKGRSSVIGGSSGGAVGIKIVPMKLKLGKTSRVVDIWIQENSPSLPLVGQNFLSGLQYEINNQLQVIKLKKLANNATSLSAEKYDPRDRNSVPFKMSGKSIIVPVEVSGQEVPMIFDTGAFGIVFPLAIWNQIKPNFKSPPKLIGRGMTSGIDGPTPTLVYTVDRIEFGPVSMTDVRVFVSSPGPTLPLLGQNVLGGEKFIIDDTKNIIHFHR